MWDKVSKVSLDKTLRLISENSKQAVKTRDIPYDSFHPPISKGWILEDLPATYPNKETLKNMMMEKEVSVPELSEFGDPSKMNCDDTYCHINGRTLQRDMIKENPIDMFEFLPPEEEFLKEFKNPCWRGVDVSGRDTLFCLPYFFIIGFTKSGTTDLFAILKLHVLISSRSVKEPHFFDRRRRGRSSRMHRPPKYPPRSFLFYINGGPYRENLFRTYQKVEGTDVLFHGITMDATPSNVWDNEYWETFHPGHKEPPITNADTIAKINPKTKIIFSLRDPISRMRSAYQFFCKVPGLYKCDHPITPEKYHDLVVEAVEKFNHCLLNNTVRGCTYSTDTHQLATHLYASIYHVYIIDFMKVFPRDQLFVLKMEERISNPISTVNDLCDFLEIPRFSEEVLHVIKGRDGGRNHISDEKKLPYVLPETIEILEEFFKPYLQYLVELLGDEKWYWDRPHS